MTKSLMGGDREAHHEISHGKHLPILIYRFLVFITILYFLYSLSEHYNCDKNNPNVLSEFQPIESRERGNSGEPQLKKTSNTNCRTIHLTAICNGFNTTRNFYVLLKSILFYRTDRIHLHLLVSDESHTIFENLISNWQVQDLEVTYYNASDHELEISWIPSSHYSNRFGLMKLAMPTILADKTNLSAIIMIDTDMLVLGNVRHLQEEMEALFELNQPESRKGGPMFGMVENQSDWYLANNTSSSSHVWPALGRGFNSGLIMINLREVRAQSWRKLWPETTEIELIYHLSAPLADQDIFNVIFRNNPQLVKKLPCIFNIQLNDHNILDESCPAHRETSAKGPLQIVHWNSPNKFRFNNNMAEFYQNRYSTFRNWNGYLLKNSPCANRLLGNNTNLITEKPRTMVDMACKDIRPKISDKLRTHLYYFEYDYQVTEMDVTYVVHLSLDRLHVLDELASHWLGPISVAIYLSEQETEILLDLIENSFNLIQRRNIGYHIVYRDNGFNYPINRLRNIALDNSLTPYVVLSDIDLLPSYNLYNYLKKTISTMDNNNNNTNVNSLYRKALVIAAFENTQYKFEFPQTKDELSTQLNLGIVSMFRQELWPRGHSQSDYSKWRTSTQPYIVQWKPDYEPFVVTSRDVPRYDERFSGFGFNKVEHIMMLAALDYQFIVLPDAFLIHKFHSPSYDIVRHRNSPTYKQCIKILEREFLVELKELKPDFFHRMKHQQQK